MCINPVVDNVPKMEHTLLTPLLYIQADFHECFGVNVVAFITKMLKMTKNVLVSGQRSIFGTSRFQAPNLRNHNLTKKTSMGA